MVPTWWRMVNDDGLIDGSDAFQDAFDKKGDIERLGQTIDRERQGDLLDVSSDNHWRLSQFGGEWLIVMALR